MRLSAVIAVVLATIASTSCSDSAAPPEPPLIGPPGFTVVRGNGQQDTAVALLDPIVLELRNADGRICASCRMTYSSPLVEDFPLRTQVEHELFFGFTDLRGEVSIRAHLGIRAGKASLQITADESGATQLLEFTVLPAKPHDLLVAPRDTVVATGRSFPLRMTAVDQWGNPIDTSATFTFTQPSSGISVSGDGVVTGVSIGREKLVARSGNWTDTIRVSVVPHATIAGFASEWRNIYGLAVARTELDGTGFQRFVPHTTEGPFFTGQQREREMAPRWRPDGNSIVFQENTQTPASGSWVERLFVADLAGARRRLITDQTFFREELHPDFSPDGDWIYFSAQPANDHLRYIWRVRFDGSGLEQLGGASNPVIGTRPSISPDGQWLAYSSAAETIRVRNIATGAMTAMNRPGTSPRWSPDGAQLAYVNSGDFDGYSGELRVALPDGAGDRRLAPEEAYIPVIDWSPDGKYILGVANIRYGLELIDVTSSARIPLSPTLYLISAAWAR